jgi:uncharacterized membrane protein YbhN (UPF0104 family)|nr:MAG: hypothetical protein KatS3mg041_0211 [Bacteroidota bacterium]
MARQVLQIGIGLLVGGVFLWMALRDVDWGAMGEALRRADYRWLPALIGVALLSHLLRAWRWQMLLHPLGVHPGLGKAFSSIMIGYMASYAIPRIGELVRAAHMARMERAAFSAVLGTIVAERALDILVLLLALLSVLLLYTDRWAQLAWLWEGPGLWLKTNTLWVGVAGVLGVVLLFGIWRWYRVRSRNGPLRHFIRSFLEGLRSVRTLSRPLWFWASTALMWFAYTVMTYLPLRMFGIAHMDLLDAWALMALASIGVVLPSPGGTGTYHFFAQQTLVLLFAVDRNAATLYALLTHGAQLVAYVLVGWVALLYTGVGVSFSPPVAEEDNLPSAMRRVNV